MRILISCGGTGGHIYPGIAVAQRFPEEQILFIGSQDRLEKRIIDKYGYDFRSVTVSRINISKIMKGIYESIKLLKEFNPDVVFSTGGYVTLPVVLAAIIKRIPLVLHEANSVPGRTNRLIGKLAKKVATNYSGLDMYFSREKLVETGMPLRIEITKAIGRDCALSKLGLKEGYSNVLLLGGSQGARYLNDIFLNSLEVLRENKIQFIWLTGEKEFLRLKENFENYPNQEKNIDVVTVGKVIVKAIPYIEEINLAYEVSDLVISRAGANTLAEVAYVGLPQVVIPYPYAKDDHQRANANKMAELNNVLVVDEIELSSKFFVSIITRFIQKKGFFEFLDETKPQKKVKEDSAMKVASVIKLCQKKR